MTENILELHSISRSYPARQGLFGRKVALRVVDDVSLSLRQSETLALVGESGSGKSTTGRIALGRPNSGYVRFRDAELPPTDTPAWRRMRRQMQMIYQDPLAVLDRRLSILDQVREPLDIHDIGSASGRNEKAMAVLDTVGLNASHAQKLPHQLSGGQRQRAVLARALIMQPALLVCDEPVSALDVSIQAQVVNLLMDLQKDLGLSLLFISHDLKVVRQIAHQTAVMYLGRIVEHGETNLLLSSPAHPYTKALVSAVPVAGRRVRERIILKGEPPNPAARPTGCAFHPRCPVALPECRSISPRFSSLRDGRSVACHAVQTEPSSQDAGS
ncbi:oligopeptide/dipeptide ABC transporter ATP-binding protein [Mesorhizobium sp.]|uniref:ABC transporter ATP-binding protein n=1 Tax=Mesorhizobium sp. TaxID=1871066 RepID=UPI000FE585DF|nr:oligopeptide/dipeptide ABC transporter ATP-binding protein [Mesorhizobium sp.]RWI16516.1 MAG: ATP-binding cassette domain-containing protein [Mesorhizobium sp.]RWN06256.1 MAG: ATP-binding cassette domain-containing protein [Mesorhizobium sp.]RWN08219.1 MAG: ATP-binding cassette domain-containing protein [Mesorhizobium sp.]TIQ97634.1 MAG: ATP-binding cassette domain-containing protein [Mesorhizobium sp.]